VSFRKIGTGILAWIKFSAPPAVGHLEFTRTI